MKSVKRNRHRLLNLSRIRFRLRLGILHYNENFKYVTSDIFQNENLLEDKIKDYLKITYHLLRLVIQNRTTN